MWEHNIVFSTNNNDVNVTCKPVTLTVVNVTTFFKFIGSFRSKYNTISMYLQNNLINVVIIECY